MNNNEVTSGKLTIKNEEIPVKHCFMRQDGLQFYPENPRIYSFVFAGGEELDQDSIEKKLVMLDHVKQLVQSIKANGGLLDPLIVREGDNVVLEGNSRLAAYRLLSRKDPIRWGMVKCSLLPEDIKEDQVFALLGEYHIIGRKDWAPFEQSGYLWRRINNHSVTPERMSKEMGLSVRVINHLVNVYSFMLEYGEADVQKWSYYDEYLKSNKIKKVRELNPNLDDIVVSKIKNGEISKARDVRDKLSRIVSAKGNTLKQFLNNSKTLGECYELAIHRGITNVIYQRIKKFREQITNPDIKKELIRMPNVQKNRCKYEIKKIKLAVDNIYEKLYGKTD